MRLKVPPPFLLMLPITIVTLVFLMAPSLLSMVFSFFRFKGLQLQGFVGLDNYVAAIGDNRFQTSLGNMVIYLAVIVPTEVLIPLFLALALNTVTKGLRVLRALIVIPTFISTIGASFTWLFVYSSYSPLQPLYAMLGMPTGPLSAPEWAIFGVAFVPIWMALGFYTLLYTAGLNSIDRSLFESAKIDGAGAWATFRNVTLALLRPTFAFVVTMSIIWNAQIFDQVYVMTRGGPGTLTYSIVFYIYRSAFTQVSLAQTYVMSVLLLVIIMSLAYVSIRYLGFGRPSWM